ncbi:MAP2K3 isoform 14 [Pan troglodytes]|uniref:MAP2K3 isoform 11 n=2 Tax=Pan troglodytes TaxID=9598 RepID=A0A6D2WEJ6_PANTR|nr:MAP2K3 isoform 11 [Pan troglodytes]PNI13680.1 MAP2K3 isoform 12 [Pan troglodytes]PNI13682.1 MAP2K3 isoform 14 [Pan troglodytes]
MESPASSQPASMPQSKGRWMQRPVHIPPRPARSMVPTHPAHMCKCP